MHLVKGVCSLKILELLNTFVLKLSVVTRSAQSSLQVSIGVCIPYTGLKDPLSQTSYPLTRLHLSCPLYF